MQDESALTFYAKAALIFPQKLHHMLEDVHQSGKTNIVSWHPRGESFVVHDEERFVREILPRYLNQLKFTSFRRQLQYFGFTRDERETATYGKRIFYHEKFVRRDPDLCLSMKSKRTPKLTKRQREEKAAAATGADRKDTGNKKVKTAKKRKTKDASGSSSSKKRDSRKKQVDVSPNYKSSSSTTTTRTRVTNVLHVAPPEPTGGHYYSDDYKYQQEDNLSNSGTENDSDDEDEDDDEDDSIDEGNTTLPTQYALTTSDGKRRKPIKYSSNKRRKSKRYTSQQERNGDNTLVTHRLMIEPTLSSANTTPTSTIHPGGSYSGGGDDRDGNAEDGTCSHRQEQVDDHDDDSTSSHEPLQIPTKSTTIAPKVRRQYKKRKPKPAPRFREYNDFELNAPCLPYQQYRYNVIFHDLR